MLSLGWLGAAILAAALAGVANPLAAAPLDEAACKSFDAEEKSLEIQGIKDDVAKGPEWAKANLSASRLELIKHYIYLKEQVDFRCPSLIVVSVPELAEPEAGQPTEKAPAKAGKKGASKKKDKKRKNSADGSVPPPAPKATVTQ